MFKKLMKKMEVAKASLGILKSALRIRRTHSDFNEYVFDLTNVDTLSVAGNTINVKLDDDGVKVTGFRYAIAHSAIHNDNMEYAIILENESKELGITDFLVNHEVGHFVNEVFINNVLFDGVRRIENEFAADLYAAQQIGFDNAINALTILSNQKNIDTLEIKSRINYLVMCKSLMNK